MLLENILKGKICFLKNILNGFCVEFHNGIIDFYITKNYRVYLLTGMPVLPVIRTVHLTKSLESMFIWYCNRNPLGTLLHYITSSIFEIFPAGRNEFFHPSPVGFTVRIKKKCYIFSSPLAIEGET